MIQASQRRNGDVLAFAEALPAHPFGWLDGFHFGLDLRERSKVRRQQTEKGLT